MVQKRFRALRIIGTFYKVLAWISLLLGALFGLLSIVAGLGSLLPSEVGELEGIGIGGALAGGVFGVGILIAGVIYFIVLYAAGEFVYLFLTIEENTRETSMLLRQISQGATGQPPEAGRP